MKEHPLDTRSRSNPIGLAGETVYPRTILDVVSFHRGISLERKRSERSQKFFLLMLAGVRTSDSGKQKRELLERILDCLCRSIRETDIAGWYEDSHTFGVAFTEIGCGDSRGEVDNLISAVTRRIQTSLSAELFNQIRLSFHVYPEDWNETDGKRPSNPVLYPDLMQRERSRAPFRAIKRAMDITASAFALLFLSPAFLLIAFAIKTTSKGPVFFRQRRAGEFGTPFWMLKFRSMYENNDSRVHKEYVAQLIAGNADKHLSHENGESVYKLTGDLRVTKVGAFLRRTSLDELPQLINVLRGEMSLVGPRPPIDYEVEEYALWHRRRLIEAKPGITGLWQVGGRNRVPFDEMVRLDLEYARSWSPWLDLKILLRTPKAVLEGAH